MSTQKPEAARFLQPEIVSRFANMALRARLIVEGFIAGMHRSPYHGFSAEFAEYRRYNPGESTKYIDWKLYAKTDRYYLKVFEDETNLRASIVLDRSASMAFSSTGITKLTYASLLAAALAYLMIMQRDAVGLAIFDSKINTLTPHRSVKKHLHLLLKELENITPGSKTSIGDSLISVAKRIKRRGLVIVMSDLMDDPDSIMASLKRLRHSGHETIVFHILDPMELKLNYHKEVKFVDMETGEAIRTQPWFLETEYNKRIEAWTNWLEVSCKDNGIDYNLLSVETPFDKALVSYLNKRYKMN
jgi:uncharacterized protein (DUF58 family)